MAFIQYGTQCIEDDDISAVVETLKSGYLTTGSKVAEFESLLSEVVGAKYTVAVSSGTAALHLAALATNVQSGDEVITTPLTFAASANCVLYCGAKPVFADIESDTLLIDIEDIKRKITKKTKAILPVHYGGELCNIESAIRLAEEHNITVIQDCAHSLGSEFVGGKKQGEYPGQQIWSFHPVKTITTGEGGAVTTNDEKLYQSLLLLRTHGITRDASQFVNSYEGAWYYEMQELGFNYRITDIQCALGVSQLKKLKRFAKRRTEIVTQYDEAFSDMPITVQESPSYCKALRHLYIILLNNSSHRREVFDKLREANIGVNVHYIPVYYMPYYQKLGYKKGLCPKAEEAYERMITLPLHPLMNNEQVEYVIEVVRNAVV